MIDDFFKRFFWIFNLAAIFAAAFLLARTVNAFVGGALITPASKLAAPKVGAARGARGKSKDKLISLTAFLDRNIFKAAREDISPEPESAETEAAEEGNFDEENCESSNLSVNLVSTIVSSDPESSMAVFMDTGKGDTHDVKLGDKLLDQAEIKSIEWRSVKVFRNGRCEMFSLEEKPKKKRTRSSAPIASNGKPGKMAFGKGVKKTGKDEYEIPRGEIDNVLSNLNQIATQARIVPSFHNGKANGFKLFSIRPGSLYSKIGIQNGDIIQKINGFEMNSPDKALEIYSKLKDAQGISVDLVRRGKTKSLNYNIR